MTTASASAASFYLDNRQGSLARVVVLSVVFHLTVFVGAPLLTHLLWRPQHFASVPTIQLVRPPLPLSSPEAKPEAKVQPRKSAKPIDKAKQLVPKKQAKPTAKDQKKQEENLDELSELLNNVPAVQVAVTGDFKYHWYLNSVQQKVERFWRPPMENKEISVIVSFTIFESGSASDVRVSQSSGNSVLDNLAVRAVKLAEPFGKLPPGFSDNRLDLGVTLYAVRQ